MHFIFQALHRRPLEPKSLAISRGISAVFLSLVFLAYVGYLIYQIYSDNRLLIISTQNLQSYPSPDVELCVYGSPFEIFSCSLMDMTFTEHRIPGCTPYLRGPTKDPNEPQWCTLFMADDLVFGVELGNSNVGGSQTTMARRINFYWAISNLTSFNAVNPWVPSVTATLYSQTFSRLRIEPENMIPQQAAAWRNLQLQRHVSTTIMNYWSTIYFIPERYRAIRPYDPLSILGINSSYVNIDTLNTWQHDWPLNNASINYTRHGGNYQGVFSLELNVGNMEVRTEQRNHTVLAALALAGGCYGVIFAIYCILYGTPKLTPFGITHGVSIWYHRGKNKLGRKKSDGDDHLPHTNLPSHPSSKNRLLALDGTSVHSTDSHEHNDNTYHSLESMHHPTTIPMHSINNSNDRNVIDKESGILIPTTTTTEEQPSASSPPPPPSSSQQQASHSSSRYLSHLESRVQELELILREYFLDVDYLDALRLRHKEYMEPTSGTTTTSGIEQGQSNDDEMARHGFSLLEPFRTRKSITGQEWAR